MSINVVTAKSYRQHLHFQLKCCGVNSSADWKSFSPGGNSVPDSCCVNVTKGCGVGAMKDAAKVHQEVKLCFRSEIK